MKANMNNVFTGIVVSILTMIFVPLNVHAADKDSTSGKITHVIGADFRPGWVFHTHEFFKGVNQSGKRINTTLGGHLKYGFGFAPDTYLGRLYPYTVQGIGIAYISFLNSS